MKVITFEQLFNYPNSDDWLYEEVSARLLVASITFKSKTGKFIKVKEIHFINLLILKQKTQIKLKILEIFFF